MALGEKPQAGAARKWICESCGFIYDPHQGDPDGGLPAGTQVEDIPEDWMCPVCGRKADFRPVPLFHHPVLVGGRLYVRPPWEEPAVRPGVEEIVIEPGPAFGTGTHPTTWLCLELILQALELRPDAAAGLGRPGGAAGRGSAGSFADLGCGLGLLAIAAAKLGFGPVVAVDCDRAAVEATARNARTNSVDLAEVSRWDLRAAPPPEAGTVAANLMRPLLLRIAGLMADRTAARPQSLIASGLLDHEASEVAAAFPLEEYRRLSLEGWTALLLVRTDR